MSDNIEDLPVEQRVSRLFNKHNWDYGYLIKSAKEGNFGFEYSEEFDDLVKKLYKVKFVKNKVRKAKHSFKFMEGLLEKDGTKIRGAQFDTAKLEYEIWLEILSFFS